MKRLAAFLMLVTTFVAVGFVDAQPLPVAKPEQVGLSSQRLERVGQTVKVQIEIGRAHV